jgi:hypothetical protein
MALHGLRHTYLTGAWYLCARCDTRQKVSEMKWQRGLLLCDDCYDYGVFPLVGQREPAIAFVLEDGKEELAPVDKLRNPDGYVDAEDICI